MPLLNSQHSFIKISTRALFSSTIKGHKAKIFQVSTEPQLPKTRERPVEEQSGEC